MRILHVLAGASPWLGISEVVAGLSCALKSQGHDVIVATLDGPLAASIIAMQLRGVRVVRFKACRPYFLFYSWELQSELAVLVRDADVVHVHSNWTFPVWWGCWCALRKKKKLVMSPHGCLDPVRLRYSAWKKHLAGWLDRFFLRRASVIHVTSEREKEWVTAYILGKGAKAQNGVNRIVVVPNGIDIEPRILTNKKQSKSKTVLYLGRLHPLKGLDLLIDAWKVLVTDYPNWYLQIIGSDEHGTLTNLRDQVRRLALDNKITFGRALCGAEKVWAMGNADLFVLPTRSENFGIVVVEALACGVPVITTKGAPWGELITEHCGWWVDVGVAPLVAAFKAAMELTDEERREMGENGRRLVEARYQWAMIAKEMARVYDKQYF